MDADERREKLDAITRSIIGCAQRVSSKLGSGFLEKVYENALGLELQRVGLQYLAQHPVKVRYEGNVVGDYIADLLVERTVIVEIKAVHAIDKVHQAQCLNYLKATGLSVCLLLNFGTPKLQVKRFVSRF